MSIKFIPKVGAALIILAIVLIFLGVNYVPKIFALSSSRGNASDPLIVTRLNYVDELYPRAIAPQLSLAGSDWIERHPLVIASQMSLAGSDWIERHPLVIASQVSFAGSDPLERALRVAVPQASFLAQILLNVPCELFWAQILSSVHCELLYHRCLPLAQILSSDVRFTRG